MTARFALAVALALAPVPVAAQDHEHHGAPPAAIGRVRFPTSCRAAAQPAFERGVALLHSFWYEEAGRAFRDAGAADTACTMAWWGLASSYLHPLWAPPTPAELQQAAAALERARANPAPTPREAAYVEAVSAFYADYAATPHPQRLRRWSDALERLHQAHPDDGEGAALYALSLLAVANASPPDSSYTRQRRAAGILEPLFQRQPNHPGLAHYLIHATDAPALARAGTRAADRYAAIAPSVPHARHMPSHIYIRLGRWDQAIASNASSAEAARQYEQQQRMDAVWDQRLHAMDYMVYAFLQQGRDDAARGVVTEAAAVQRYSPERGITSEYALAAIPARYALERGEWREAAALPLRPGFQAPAEAVTRFARVIGAARSGDAALARTELAALAAIDDDLTRRAVPLWAGMVRAQRLAAAAWVALADGDTAAAVARAFEAADLEDRIEKHPVTPGAILPARELFGDLLLALGQPAPALAVFEAALAQQPRRGRSLAGAARAAEAAGDRPAALRYRRELRELLARADRERRVAAGAAY